MASVIIGDYEYISGRSGARVRVVNTGQSSYGEILSSVEIDGVIYVVIGMSRCFQNCTSLTIAPSIPNSVTNMSYCFQNCTSLTIAPTIPNSVTNMSYCFSNCTSLTIAPSIPNSVTNMSYCFQNCFALDGSTIVVKNNPSKYTDIFSNINLKIAVLGENQTEAIAKWTTIVTNYTNISMWAGQHGDSLNIGDYKYQRHIEPASGYDGMTVLALDKTKTSYEEILSYLCINNVTYNIVRLYQCFQNCTNLTKAPSIPETVISLVQAFDNCTSLQTAPIIPSNASNINAAFRGCTSLAGTIQAYNSPSGDPPLPFNNTTQTIKIAVMGENQSSKMNAWTKVVRHYSNVDFWGTNVTALNPDRIAIEDYQYTYSPVDYLSATVIKKGKSNYGKILSALYINNQQFDLRDISYCFEDCTLLTTPPDISDAHAVMRMRSCFEGCTSLTTAPIIPNSVEDISYCFRDCTSLTTPPDIPDFVTNMDSCFRDCTLLTTAPDIPDLVTNMHNCFYNCTSLTTPPDMSNAGSVTNMHNCFLSCTSLTTAPIIPNSVEGMSYCFYNCTSLTIPPDIPDFVTNMGYCFDGCISLKGNINVCNSPTYFTNIFTGTKLDIYIVDNTINKTVSDRWREIVQSLGRSNIHFEADDHTSPTAAIKFQRIDAQGEYSSSGEYIYVDIISKISQDKLPNGWVASLTSENLYLDSTIPLTIISGSQRQGPYTIGDEKHTLTYILNDGFKTTTTTVVVSAVMALLDFLGTGSQGGYIDIPGMGMAIGGIAKRDGLDISFPTTIGEGLLPPTTWAITLDTEVDPNKTYYEEINNNYVEVLNPSGNPHEQSYYEKDAAVDLNNYQLLIGQFNKRDNDAIFIAGNGTNDTNRSNAFIINRYGNLFMQGMIGFIQMYGGSTAPNGWFMCNGQEVLITDYPELYAVIGDTYDPNGEAQAGYFKLPDFRNNFPVGAGDDYSLNDSGGYKDAAIIDHTHVIPANAMTSGGMSANVTHSHQLGRNKDTVNKGTNYDKPNDASATSDRGYRSTNANLAHTHNVPNADYTVPAPANAVSGTDRNLPPYIGINFIIHAGRPTI